MAKPEQGAPEQGASERIEPGPEGASEALKRPGPVRWLWYAVGGRLPARYREWVLHDLTGRTWALRHFARALVQVAPFVVALLLLVPGSLAVRVAAVTAGLLLGLLYSGAYMYEIVEHRVAQAGYPVGTAQQVRDEANSEVRQADAERYARTWRQPELNRPEGHGGGTG
jgi:hypothetical protein